MITTTAARNINATTTRSMCRAARISGWCWYGSYYWLSNQFGLPRLDLYYLVGGVAGLWVIGQLAAWQPSLRAAKVSPAMATRSV